MPFSGLPTQGSRSIVARLMSDAVWCWRQNHPIRVAVMPSSQAQQPLGQEARLPREETQHPAWEICLLSGALPPTEIILGMPLAPS